jgi:hypothetical protein
MDTERQAHIVFHLMGTRPVEGLDEVVPLELRPALLAGHRDLTQLRYDFPLVLVHGSTDGRYAQPLSAVMDEAFEASEPAAPKRNRLKRQLLRVEQEIRRLVAGGASGPLTTLWDSAEQRLESYLGDRTKSGLVALRAALKVDGEVVDCGATLPQRVLTHAWREIQETKTRKLRTDVTRLITRLADILRADYVRSEAGRSAQSLKASVGAGHEDVFDFEEMSRLLVRAAPKAWLSESHRQRIGYLLAALESHRLFTLPGESEAQATGPKAHSFVFTDCAGALKAYRERLPKLVDLAKAMTMAVLELKGEYSEAKHDAFFAQYGEQMLGESDLAQFPDYLVCLNARDLKSVENLELADLLSAGLPMKFLVQSDDILEQSSVINGRLAFGDRVRQLAGMAIGQSNVFVLQASASHLYQVRDRIVDGLTYPGPALFSVFSGATEQCGDLPPYLVAAAAMESRAFPSFSYDPSAGLDLADRFRLEGNPQQDRDWPGHDLNYEDEAHQRQLQSTHFTVVDFAACDQRYARYFAKLVKKANGSLVAVADYLASEPKDFPDKVPALMMVDRDNRLQHVLVEEKLMREARRCGDAWHALQELGGIGNSHAQRLLAQEKATWQELQAGKEPERAEPPAPAEAASEPAPLAEPAPVPKSDDPYIETPRCSTCNECTEINGKMFRYDGNKQAYIADPDAGTYRQMIEAAESCQLSIIHPGKPRNLHEEGLDELRERAEPFL